MTMSDRRRRFRRFVRLLGIGMVGAPVFKELPLPKGDRTWHGPVGVVPYALRPPTLSRMRQRVWDPDSTQVFVPTLFGVGWTLNIGGAIALLRKAISS